MTLAAHCAPLFAAPEKRRFKLGACDWSIGKQADLTAFALAKQMGLDGVQVSMAPVGDDMPLCHADLQRQYKAIAKETGLEIASLGVHFVKWGPKGPITEAPYKSDPRAARWVSESIDVSQALGTRVVLVGFFGDKSDLRGDKAGTEEVVRRLKAVAPKAEKAGVILGLESLLSAEQLIDIMDRVGSKAVQVYYDVRNTLDEGYDIYQEIRKLGKQRICELHAKENGALLGQGKVDFKKVRAALDDIDYRGWVQIEGAIPRGKPVLESYQANCKFLRGIFNA